MAESGMIPNVFMQSSPITPTYSFIDASTGLGYIEFQCLKADQAASASILSTQALTSTPTYTDGTAGSYVDETLALTLDFPITCQKSIVSEGKMFVTCKYGNRNGAFLVNARIKVILEKNGAEVISGYSSVNGFGTVATKTSTVALTVPITTFNPADTLNLSIEMYCQNGAQSWASPQIPSINHDPLIVADELALFLPVRIDI